MSIAEQIAAIEETLAAAIDARDDFRRCRLSVFAAEAEQVIALCRQELAKLRGVR